MNEKDRKRNAYFKIRQEAFGDQSAARRTAIYEQTQKLQDMLQEYLTQEADKKRTKVIYFTPTKGQAREKNVRVVYFHSPIRVSDPEGMVGDEFFQCVKLVEMPGDRAAKQGKEWVLENRIGRQVLMEELSVDDILLLIDRLFDDDCSLNPEWTEGGE